MYQSACVPPSVKYATAEDPDSTLEKTSGSPAVPHYKPRVDKSCGITTLQLPKRNDLLTFDHITCGKFTFTATCPLKE